MGLTSGLFLAVLIAGALGTVVATAVLWDRIRRPVWVRWVARVTAILMVQLVGCAAIAVAVNDQNVFFASWSDLAGRQARVTTTAPPPGGLDRRLQPGGHAMRGSRIVRVEVPVAGRTEAIVAEVYLPSAYFAPRASSRQFSVVELLDGFPGSPESWLHQQSLNVQHVLDAEIDSGRATPFIAVMPEQNFQGTHDGECINAVGGVQVENTLIGNVRRVIDADFRVAGDAGSWSVMGYSTGGYCALNFAMRHPDSFGSAVSLDGYTSPYIDGTTGHLFGDDLAARHANDPQWLVEHARRPRVAVLMAYCDGDRVPGREAHTFAAAAHAPLLVDLLHTPGGAHNFATFRLQEPAAFDWISRHVTPPLAPGAGVRGHTPHPAPSRTHV